MEFKVVENGLWEGVEINKSKVGVFGPNSDITFESITPAFLEETPTTNEEARQFVLYTGIEGLTQFSNALETSIAEQQSTNQNILRPTTGSNNNLIQRDISVSPIRYLEGINHIHLGIPEEYRHTDTAEEVRTELPSIQEELPLPIISYLKSQQNLLRENKIDMITFLDNISNNEENTEQ